MVIEFLRKRDYILVKELGQGACGKTVLLHDDVIDQKFVCKKFSPQSDDQKQQLFSNFIREIKLLHSVYHQNIVRVFNYYLYPDQLSGYILMEHISGKDVQEFLIQYPEKVNDIFMQVIQGFKYLESNRILHRDIRTSNIMVNDDGLVKIIDFGFSKKIVVPADYDKSISLNWWCDLPGEFDDAIYNNSTEVYFIGKLFEKLILENNINHFKYKTTLTGMCIKNPRLRTTRFSNVELEIQKDPFIQIDFSDDEVVIYREFSDCLYEHIVKIQSGISYHDDIEKIQIQLGEVYRSCMLEKYIRTSSLVVGCFLDGTYYHKTTGFPVSIIKNFLELLSVMTHEKKKLILINLQTKLDAIKRYSKEEDDAPF